MVSPVLLCGGGHAPSTPVPPPIVQLIKRKPWLAVKLLARDIPEPRQPTAN